MATISNLPESSTWETGIQQLERSDLWDAGIGGSGIANKQAKQLANRSVYLKDQIDKIKNRQNYYLDYANQTMASNSILNAKGTVYVLNFPMSDWDYTTPNDGITRYYMVEICMHVGTGFTYSSSASVTMNLHTTTAGPVLVTLAFASSFQPGVTVMTRKRIQLGPNVRVKASFNVGPISSSVVISQASFHIEEII